MLGIPGNNLVAADGGYGDNTARGLNRIQITAPHPAQTQVGRTLRLGRREGVVVELRNVELGAGIE